MKLPALREIVEERKEKAIENLSVSYAKNRLPLEEYERLVEYINKIESERELIVVEKMVAEYGAGNEPESPPESSPDYDDDDEEGDQQSSSGSNLTILSSRTISGPLKSGSQFVSILGSGCLRVRKADLSKRKTVLNMAVILGEYAVYVEPGIRVVNNAIPILGNAGVDHKVRREAQDGKELVITGTVLLGDIKVKLLKTKGKEFI